MNQVRLLFSGIALTASCLSGAVLAQDGVSEPAIGNAIIVTEDREPVTRREVSRQARSITAHALDIHEVPLARFERPICPGIANMPLEYAEIMVDRIRYNAEDVGLRISSEEGCRPNVLVLFTNDSQSDMEKLREDRGHLFSLLTNQEKQELFNDEGPARVWTTVETRTRDGLIVPSSRTTDGKVPVARTWMAHSKIYTGIRRDITFAAVLIDIEAIDGMSVVQLADYATMRAFARTQPPENDAPSIDSILTLFSSADDTPYEMSDFDRAYLRSLYDSIPNLPGISKVLGVNRQLRHVEREREGEEEGS